MELLLREALSVDRAAMRLFRAFAFGCRRKRFSAGIHLTSDLCWRRLWSQLFPNTCHPVTRTDKRKPATGVVRDKNNNGPSTHYIRFRGSRAFPDRRTRHARRVLAGRELSFCRADLPQTKSSAARTSARQRH